MLGLICPVPDCGGGSGGGGGDDDALPLGSLTLGPIGEPVLAAEPPGAGLWAGVTNQAEWPMCQAVWGCPRWRHSEGVWPQSDPGGSLAVA